MASAMVQAGGYIYLAAKGCPTLKIPVESADQASAMLCAYRDRYMLGASHMKRGCGEIRSNNGTVVAKVSYNGRVWTPDNQLLQEPVTGKAGSHRR